MRTTIDLDDELLRTAKAISNANRQTLSRVISDLAWKGLLPAQGACTVRNGFPVLVPSVSGRPYGPKHVKEMAAEFEDGTSAAGLIS